MLEKGLDEKRAVWTEINYLERHGEAGHLAYATFRLGNCRSVAARSKVRFGRVINLRMKGNSVFWKEENAEGMLDIAVAW